MTANKITIEIKDIYQACKTICELSHEKTGIKAAAFITYQNKTEKLWVRTQHGETETPIGSTITIDQHGTHIHQPDQKHDSTRLDNFLREINLLDDDVALRAYGLSELLYRTEQVAAANKDVLTTRLKRLAATCAIWMREIDTADPTAKITESYEKEPVFFAHDRATKFSEAKTAIAKTAIIMTAVGEIAGDTVYQLFTGKSSPWLYYHLSTIAAWCAMWTIELEEREER